MAATSFTVSRFGAALTSRIDCNASTFVGNQSLNLRVGHGVPRACPPPLRSVGLMAKREQELVEIRNMSDEQINDMVTELEGELVVLRMKTAARQDVRNSEFQRMRKRIARMLTVKRERELVQGITKRESRKLDKIWRKSVVIKPPPSLLAVMNKDKEEK